MFRDLRKICKGYTNRKGDSAEKLKVKRTKQKFQNLKVL